MRTKEQRAVTVTREREGAGSVQSVHRALDLLFMVVSAAVPLTPSEIAARLELPRPTVYRLADTLIERGLVARSGGALVATEKFFALASGGRSALRLRDAVEPFLGRLVAETGETGGLHVAQGELRRCILEVEGHNGIRWVRGVGYTASVWVGAVGYVLLAGLSEGALSDLLTRFAPRALADGSTLDRERLLENVGRARAQGWSESVSETVEGAAAIAAPVRRGDTVVGAVNLYAPADRVQKLRQAVPALVATAGAASAAWTSCTA